MRSALNIIERRSHYVIYGIIIVPLIQQYYCGWWVERGKKKGKKLLYIIIVVPQHTSSSSGRSVNNNERVELWMKEKKNFPVFSNNVLCDKSDIFSRNNTHTPATIITEPAAERTKKHTGGVCSACLILISKVNF